MALVLSEAFMVILYIGITAEIVKTNSNDNNYRKKCAFARWLIESKTNAKKCCNDYFEKYG